MKKLKKIAEGLGLVLAALAVAALCTWIAADDSDKAEITQSLEGAVSEESEHEEPLGIEWDSLSQEIVAWVEVPNTSISQPVAKADKQNPNLISAWMRSAKAATAPHTSTPTARKGRSSSRSTGTTCPTAACSRISRSTARKVTREVIRASSCIPVLVARTSYRSLPWTPWAPAPRRCAQVSTILARLRSGLAKATSFYLNTMGQQSIRLRDLFIPDCQFANRGICDSVIPRCIAPNRKQAKS